MSPPAVVVSVLAVALEDALKGKDVKATVKQAAAQIRTVDIAQGLVERTVLQALG